MVTLKGHPVHLKGTLPKVGQRVPDFLLVDADLQNKTLKDFSGKKLLVVVPSLDTPVCSLSGKKFHEMLKDQNVQLILISADLPFAQKRCYASEGLKVTSLSMMRDKSFAEDYGVLIQDGPLAGICARAVFLLDEDDKLLYLELVPEITQEPEYKKMLSHLTNGE